MAEETTFLRDQVERLNAVLSEYQQKYPLVSLPHNVGGEGAGTNWMTDRQLMAPLLTEYDAGLEALRNQVEQYKREQGELQVQVHKLMAENSRLTRQLKETIQSQLEELDPEALTPDIGDDQLLKNLQAQLQSALQEKEAAIEMWHASQGEVERLEAHLSTTHSNPRLSVMEAQVQQIKAQYSNTVSDLNNELTSLREEMNVKGGELQASAIQVAELRATLDEMRSKVKRYEAEKSMSAGTTQKSQHMASNLHRKVTELESSLNENERKFSSVRRGKVEIEEQLIETQKRCNENEGKAYEAMLQVRESVQMVENALLEKDAALQSAKQGEDEIERLTAALNKVIDEAGARTREEVDIVKKQCNHNIARLMEEIDSLELESTNNQSQLERMVREKRAVEAELDKITREGTAQGNKECISIEELTRRACDAERYRDEALVKLEAVEQQNRRLEMTYKGDNCHLATKNTQLSDRLTDLNQEYEVSSLEKVSLLEKIDEIKRKLSSLQSERDAAVRNKTKEVTIMEQELRQKEQDYELRLQSLEDANRHTTKELRSMLSSQQRMSAKWKEECNGITKKFEGKMSDLRTELSREKKRCGELSRLLKESSSKTAETQHMLSEYTHNIQRMESRVRSAEQRATESKLLISRQHKANNSNYTGRNLAEENRQLKQELERSLRESRIKSGSEPDTLNLADLGTGGGL